MIRLLTESAELIRTLKLPASANLERRLREFALSVIHTARSESKTSIEFDNPYFKPAESPMTFQRLQGVLGSLQQYRPAEETQLQQVLRDWSGVVGLAVAAQTRPVTVQRDVLKVATANAGWAQNLVFERRRILEKLNARLTTPLSDIRFSTTHWHSPDNRQALDQVERSALWLEHPSRVEDVPIPKASLSTADPKTAFHYWATVMQSRSQHLPLCPECDCPSPIGELQRWSVCAVCIAKRW